MRILYSLLFLCAVSFTLQAQSDADRPCGVDEHHQYLMRTNEEYRKGFVKQKTILDSLKRIPAAAKQQKRMVQTIPVVVHVIHLGDPIGVRTNISDQQIYAAIDGLNDRYANLNGNGVEIGINFCLANRDPNGCPTSGIVRVDGSAIPLYREQGVEWAGNCGANERDVKDLSKWPTWEYYNIWVVHDICGDIAGYAYYPNGNEYDGTVIDIASMTYESRTLAHELGHGLNIAHTFAGEDDTNCPPNFDCLEDGDEICDTPPHRRGDCGFNNPCSSEGEWNNSRFNWMSYCFTTVEDGRFTEDQRVRMLDAISVNPRAALLNSLACSNDVNMQITSDNSLMCEGEMRILSAVPEGGFFSIASGQGVIIGDTLIPTEGGIVTVEYTIAQENCSSSVYQDISVRNAPTPRLRSDEDSLCIGQSTTLQGLPGGGTITLLSGPGEIDSNTVIATGAGQIELLYEVLTVGCLVRDTHIISSLEQPVVDIEQLVDDVLTAIPDTGIFQWVRCDENFEAVEGATEAIFQASGSGNYAVIKLNGNCRDTSDCINLEITSVGGPAQNPIRVYPNPAKDVLHIELPELHQEVKIEMIDLFSRTVFSENHPGHSKVIIHPNLAPGVYFLQVRSKTAEWMTRVVID